MDIFNVIAGTASIISLIISIISFCKINEVERIIKTNVTVKGKDNTTNTSSGDNNQIVQTGNVNGSTINQSKI